MLQIMEAINFLNKGEVILVPTDTNYALAVDVFNEDACEKIYSIKGRDINKPLTLFFAETEDIWRYISPNEIQKKLFSEIINKYWPGPLNIIMPRSKTGIKNRYIDEESVSVVYNKNNTLQQLLRKFGKPIAMSSANISGVSQNTLITYENATSIFRDKIGYVLKDISNKKDTNMSSTIISLLNNKIEVIRQGDINVCLDSNDM